MHFERHALWHPGFVGGISTLCLLGVTACQAIPAEAPAQSASQTSDSGLAAVPNCATGLSATLSDGLQVGYRGSDPDDPDRCLLDWSGRSYSLYFGLWSTGPNKPMSDGARAAFRAALTGPVGTEASFEDQRSLLWKRVTVTHAANASVDVAGATRPTVELRVVRHDAGGRPDVRAETRYTIDRATGVMLRSESVTPMADGAVTTTTSWQIGTLGKAS
jgi:hypothetical protein